MNADYESGRTKSRRPLAELLRGMQQRKPSLERPCRWRTSPNTQLRHYKHGDGSPRALFWEFVVRIPSDTAFIMKQHAVPIVVAASLALAFSHEGKTFFTVSLL